MKKEILKGFSMVVVVVGLAFVTAVVSANGQSPNRVVANIPFDFVVGDKALTSGQYTVRAFPGTADAVLISDKDAKALIVRLTNTLQPNSESTQARLVFHRYGEYYFLAEVWSGGDNSGRMLLRSKRERAIERELASIVSKTELASNTYETIELLAVVR